jgi:hypothetical protein
MIRGDLELATGGFVDLFSKGHGIAGRAPSEMPIANQ